METRSLMLIFFAFLSSLATVCAFWCPEKYQKYSLEHTYCLQCCGCKILNKGVSTWLKNFILDKHNEFRSRVAGGFDYGVDHLPRASNMMQLSWDDELAVLAQNWANACKFSSDCELCRMVDRFIVGQMYWEYEEKIAEDFQSDFWSYFHGGLPQLWKEHVANYSSSSGHRRYTQLLWAKTYKIGCGFAYFHNKRSILVCNYGPTGNVEGEEVYKAGDPCSACPANTCCGDSCKKYGKKGPYKGLCKLIDESLPPDGNQPHKKVGNELFYCSFKGEPDCAYTVDGVDRWHTNITIGSWLTTIMKRRENSILHFNTPIKSKSGKLCITVETRSGPTVADEAYLYNITAKLERKEFDIYLSNIKFPSADEKLKHYFHKDYVQPTKVPIDQEMKFSLTFSVPKDSDIQYFDIDRIIAEEKDCPKVTTEQQSTIRKAGCE